MPLSVKFWLFQCTIFLPFITGYLMQDKFADPRQFTRTLVRLNIIGLEPLIIFWCMWQLHLTVELLVLPLAGLFLVLTGLAAGWIFEPALRLHGKKRQTFLVSASLANHGFTMGGFLCYFFLGEKGLALAVLLILYFIPYVYGFIFPTVKAVARTATPRQWHTYILDVQNMPLFAMLAAVVLQMFGLKRPEMYVPVDVLLLISIALYYLTLGLNFSRVDIKGLKKEHLCMAAIKFIVVPFSAYTVCSLLQLSPPIKAVIIIQACMPAAVYSVVTAVLFELDAQFASSILVCNTLIFLAIVLPVLFLARVLI